MKSLGYASELKRIRRKMLYLNWLHFTRQNPRNRMHMYLRLKAWYSKQALSASQTEWLKGMGKTIEDAQDDFDEMYGIVKALCKLLKNKNANN